MLISGPPGLGKTTLAHIVARHAGYRSVECVDDPDQYVVDVATRAGTLVLFDTVASPHEVLPTEAGARVAAAGWFHEPAQEPPDWY